MTCAGPGPCKRTARAHGLCTGHLAQQARGAPLAPLAPRGGDLVVFPVRVPRPVAEAAQRDPEGARAALSRWARRRA